MISQRFSASGRLLRDFLNETLCDLVFSQSTGFFLNDFSVVREAKVTGYRALPCRVLLLTFSSVSATAGQNFISKSCRQSVAIRIAF